MSPKDKAQSLIDAYIASGCLFANAKKCALIAINEVIENERMYHQMFGPLWDYLQNVKSEIENTQTP